MAAPASVYKQDPNKDKQSLGQSAAGLQTRQTDACKHIQLRTKYYLEKKNIQWEIKLLCYILEKSSKIIDFSIIMGLGNSKLYMGGRDLIRYVQVIRNYFIVLMRSKIIDFSIEN